MNSTAKPNTGIPNPKEQTIPSASNLFKSCFLILGLLGSFYATQQVAEQVDNVWLKGAFIALVSVWNGMLMIGMGVLSHEAVHRVLFRTPFWNELWGGVLAAIVLIPLEANRQFHMEHHRFSHQPGLDPENPMHQTSFLFAVVLGPFIALFAQYQVLASIALRGDFVRVLKDVFYVGVALSIYFLLLPALGVSLMLTWVPTLLALPLVFSVRALADHYGIPPVERNARNKEESEEELESGVQARPQVSGWVVLTPQWLQWLWSHVNYHEVHHKYPYLSHKYLAQAFEASRNQYPYLVVDGYWKSLFNVMKRDYYATQDDVRPFMTMQK
ncbi:MAG: fatty acid desaturase [Nitrosomonadales bacterium]|nr:fatty acid desaturase [Nitrosomonadales bacterium]